MVERFARFVALGSERGYDGARGSPWGGEKEMVNHSADMLAPSEPPQDPARLALRAQELELRLKELEIQDKEWQQRHRPSALRGSLTNPAVIAAAIAAWASLTAGGLTWLSGQISAASDERKFEANLITESVKTGDPDQAAVNLQFLLQSGLLTGDLAPKVENYLKSRQAGQGRTLPAK
jgi:hypothetical protein